MRRATTQHGLSLYAAAGLVGLLAIIDLAGAQAPKGPSSQNQVQVYLVRQDFSDCTNSTVPDTEGPLVSGDITVVRDAGGATAVKVAMTASPNTTYHVFLKCVRQIGDVVTEEEGTGIQVFSFPTNLVGNVFAFDIYPEGAPSGNKFQSVQVVFK
jgi:hypothetical protein